MKKFRVFLFVLIVLFLGTISAFAVNDGCLTLVYPDDGWEFQNRDSIKVDTCMASPTYKKWYSKKGYKFGISNYLFKKLLSLNDRKTWADIDSQFVVQKIAFQNLANKFGSYTIRRSESSNDSVHLVHPAFIIDFVNYNLVDSVTYYIEKIDSVLGCQLNNYPTVLNIDDSDKSKNKADFEIIETALENQLDIRILNALNNEISIEIFNSMGNIVLKTNQHYSDKISINISELSKGIYFVKYNNQILKFIKY
jgi:hypothetical protein